MGNIINKILSGILLLMVCQSAFSQVVEQSQQVFGNWTSVKSMTKDFTKYNIEQIKILEKSILHVENEKIYFEGLSFIDTCYFSKFKIKYSYLFDKSNPEYHWYEGGVRLLQRKKDTGPLPSIYSRAQLSKFISVDLGCGYDLSILFLNKDTLILNYLGGVTLFLVKIPNETKTYQGVGSELQIVDWKTDGTFLVLDYNFYAEPDKLIVENIEGNILFQTKMITKKNTIRIPINAIGTKKIFVKINSNKRDSKWSYSVKVY